jgi:hypothetical protein
MVNSDLDLSGRPLTGSPRDQRRFVNRTDEFDQTWQSLSLRANVLLVGDPGIGKTSFLRKLEAEIDGSHPLGGAAYVDGAPAGSLEQLIAAIHTGLRRKGKDLSPLPPESLEHGQGLPTYELLGALRPVDTPTLFPTAVLLDEPMVDLAHTLFGRLRDATWQLPYTWVVAIDSVDKARLTKAPADAFFGVTVELRPLPHQSSVELLQHHLDGQVPDLDLERLARLADGSPRRLLALARAVLVGRDSLDDLEVAKIRRESLITQASEPAQELARYLADSGPSSASDPDLLSHFDWTRNRAVQVFNELSRLRIVVASAEKGGRRKFYSLT